MDCWSIWLCWCILSNYCCPLLISVLASAESRISVSIFLTNAWLLSLSRKAWWLMSVISSWVLMEMVSMSFRISWVRMAWCFLNCWFSASSPCPSWFNFYMSYCTCCRCCFRCSFSSFTALTKGIIYWIPNSKLSSGDYLLEDWNGGSYESALGERYSARQSGCARSRDGWGLGRIDRPCLILSMLSCSWSLWSIRSCLNLRN